MHINIPHKLVSKAEAKAQAQKLVADIKSKMGDKALIEEERWEGETLHFAVSAQGQRITGTLESTDAAFVLDAKLPLMLKLFEGRIEKMIEEQSKQMFGGA